MNFKHGTDFSPIASKSLHKVVLPMLYVRGLLRYPETRPPLSRIFYVGDDRDPAGNSRVLERLSQFVEHLRYFRGFYEEFSKNSGIREPLIRLVQELLDEIRFLFKSAGKWKKEKEVRALWMRYDQNSDDIKTDCEKGGKYIDALRGNYLALKWDLLLK